MRNWKDIPIPKRMRGLGRDARGYPIPFILLRDTDGKAHFTINDTSRARRCVLEKRCPICGNRLEQPLWLVGGPKSAFHEHGAYFDTAMHHDCMTYALQVCPYLAMPSYLGRIDTGSLTPEKTPADVMLFVDNTMIPERPDVFVAVASNKQIPHAETEFSSYTVRPARPYLAVEYWRNGEQISEADGKELVIKALQKGIGL